VSDEVEMRTGVDSLLGRVAEFAPLDPEEAEARRVDRLQANCSLRRKSKPVAIRSRFQEGRETSSRRLLDC